MWTRDPTPAGALPSSVRSCATVTFGNKPRKQSTKRARNGGSSARWEMVREFVTGSRSILKRKRTLMSPSRTKIASNFCKRYSATNRTRSYIYLWTLQDRRATWFQNLKEAASDAARISDHDVYAGCGIFRETQGTFSRGKVENVDGIPGFCGRYRRRRRHSQKAKPSAIRRRSSKTSRGISRTSDGPRSLGRGPSGVVEIQRALDVRRLRRPNSSGDPLEAVSCDASKLGEQSRLDHRSRSRSDADSPDAGNVQPKDGPAATGSDRRTRRDTDVSAG